MASRVRAISLLALGLALAAASGDAQAAPATPPPPPPKAQPATPPPPLSPGVTFQPATPPPPSGSTGATPPPPSRGTTSPGQLAPVESEEPPQDLSNTWGYSRLKSTLQPRYVRSEDPALAAPNPVGFYSGVSVQGNHVPPFPATSTTPVVMTWTGFERAPEGSRVFFELSAAATYDVDRKGQTLRIRMRNTKVNVRNNMRRLDLRYFQTPVRTVKVSRRGRDTVATIVLERNAEPTVQIIDGKAGYSLLVVQFADQAATATSTPPPPPPPSP